MLAFVTKGVANSNVELSARNGWKLFPHGVTEFIVMKRRIDGSWWMPIIRQLHVILVDPSVTILPDDVKALVASACTSIYAVHAALRLPVPKMGLPAYQAQIDTCLEKIVGLFKNFSPSACRSIKFHWPRHWAFTRRQLGCAADEKSLERKLGETHKKMYKYTSKKDDVLGQMARADQRHVQLRELLHASKMQPITGHDGAEPLAVLCTHCPRLETELIGTPVLFNPAGTGLELPRTYSDNARASIMRVARRAHLRGPMWEAPIRLTLGIKMVIEDQQLPEGDPDRLVPVTFRSRAMLWGKPRYDDVKVSVEGSAQTLYFARCGTKMHFPYTIILRTFPS